MLGKRILVTVILLPIGVFLINLGGLPYALLIALVLGLAAWEYVRLFRAGGLQPASFLIPAGVLLLLAGRMINGFQSAPWMISLLVLVSMTYHLVAYERGQDQPGTNLALTLTGIFYIGWIGSYFISLRDLPEGKWWVLLVLPSVWLADSGAFLVGRKIGRHKLSPRLSPKKSREGYLAGLLCGTIGGGLVAALLRVWTGPNTAITVQAGVIIGFILGVLTPLGDLGESMIKRQVGVKDSSNLIPGHGGVFDRIDSWLWAVVIGYHVALFFH